MAAAESDSAADSVAGDAPGSAPEPEPEPEPAAAPGAVVYAHRTHEWMTDMAHHTAALDKEALRDLIADVLDLDPAEVTDHAHFVDDLEVDSLMALEITVRLEREYAVKMTEAEITGITSLQGTYDLLDRKLAAPASAPEVAA